MNPVKIIQNDRGWSAPWFPSVLAEILGVKGNSIEAAYLKDKIESGTSSIDGLLEDRRNLPPTLATSLEKLGVQAKFNEKCYWRQSPELTRVIQWPNNSKLRISDPDSYYDIYSDLPYRHKFNWVDRDTPIGSAGSCFAMRLAHQLQMWEYNYVIEEDDLPCDLVQDELVNTSFRMGSARSGTLFNVPSMRQMVQRAFGEWSPEKILVNDNGRLRDPFRSIKPCYGDVDGYLRDFEAHSKALRRALSRCKVFIFTLGLTEAWRFSHSGEYTSVAPHNIDGCMLEPHELNVEENVKELEHLFEVFRRNNPEIKLIISVSPVPLNKTYSQRQHVVSANALSKATLRVAAEEFCNQHPNEAVYFPSYEVVTACTRNPWESDMRHVSPEAVDRVMQLFKKMFIVGGGKDLESSLHLPPSNSFGWSTFFKGRIKKFLRILGGERLVNMFRKKRH